MNLRIVGPTPLPPAVREALARPMINHRGPEFAAMQTRIVNSLKRYTGASEDDIKAAAVVKETLHNAGGTTELSSIGLVWALGSDGFLYTAMNGALKYSGGVGTYVTFAAHKTVSGVRLRRFFTAGKKP